MPLPMAVVPAVVVMATVVLAVSAMVVVLQLLADAGVAVAVVGKSNVP